MVPDVKGILGPRNVIVDVVEMYIANGCDEGCRVCTGVAPSKTCTNCDIGWFMESGSDDCLTECPTGFYGNAAVPLNPVCTACDTKCTKCNGPNENQCSACVVAHFLAVTTCTPCALGCLECTSASADDC